MTTSTKKNIIIALFIIGMAIMLWLLLRNPKTPDSHNDDHIEVLAARDSINKLQAIADHLRDSTKKIIAGRDSSIAELKAQKNIVNYQLNKSKSTAQQLADELKALRDVADTSLFARKVDSLINEIGNLTFLVTDYQHLTDSLQNKLDHQEGDLKSLLNKREELYSQLRSSFDIVNAKYETLFRDYSKSLKTIRREKLKTKIAALIGLIGSAVILITK